MVPAGAGQSGAADAPETAAASVAGAGPVCHLFGQQPVWQCPLDAVGAAAPSADGAGTGGAQCRPAFFRGGKRGGHSPGDIGGLCLSRLRGPDPLLQGRTVVCGCAATGRLPPCRAIAGHALVHPAGSGARLESVAPVGAERGRARQGAGAAPPFGLADAPVDAPHPQALRCGAPVVRFLDPERAANDGAQASAGRHCPGAAARLAVANAPR